MVHSRIAHSVLKSRGVQHQKDKFAVVAVVHADGELKTRVLKAPRVMPKRVDDAHQGRKMLKSAHGHSAMKFHFNTARRIHGVRRESAAKRSGGVERGHVERKRRRFRIVRLSDAWRQGVFENDSSAQSSTLGAGAETAGRRFGHKSHGATHCMREWLPEEPPGEAIFTTILGADLTRARRRCSPFGGRRHWRPWRPQERVARPTPSTKAKESA